MWGVIFVSHGGVGAGVGGSLGSGASENDAKMGRGAVGGVFSNSIFSSPIVDFFTTPFLNQSGKMPQRTFKKKIQIEIE